MSDTENLIKKEEAPSKPTEDVEEEIYKDVWLGGLRGTDFFYKVYMLVTIQYFLSTMSIWLATGDSLPEEFKEGYKNHVIGIISLTLLVLVWLCCYFLTYLPKEAQVKYAWWWWPVYGVYVLVFAYAAGYISLGGILEVNFLFNLYILTSFAGVWIYALVAHMQRWYLRTGYMIIVVICFNYVSWTIMHYAGLTDAGMTANLLTAGAAGSLVIMGIVFTAVVLENGYRYDEDEYVYCAILFLIETFIIIFNLIATLYIQPRKPFIREDSGSVDYKGIKERKLAEKNAPPKKEGEAPKKEDAPAPANTA